MKHTWIVLLIAILLVGTAAGIPSGPSFTFDSLTANPASLPPDGSSSSTIIATINGTPLQNNVIYFQIESGSGNLTTPYHDSTGYFNITDSSGKAYASLQAPSTPGNTTVRAWTQADLLTREVTVEFTSAQPPHPSPNTGDVNRNNRLDTGDATLILRSIVGLVIPSTSMPILPIGDMNCNGKIETGDATIILRMVVGLPVPRCWE